MTDVPPDTEFGDWGGAEEPDEVLDDPENQAAAEAIRNSALPPKED